MKSFLVGLAQHVRAAVRQYSALGHARAVEGISPGGDSQFDIDRVAERAVREFLRAEAPVPLAVYTEDGELDVPPRARHLLVVDPIDGTRPASAGLEMAMVSIALAPYGAGAPRLREVTAALLMELATGAWLYGDDAEPGITSHGYPAEVPRLSRQADLSKMFWSIELNGHPMALMSRAYGHLVDRSANPGGVFVFNSATYSISRIITGQLDAYVDVGNRILQDHPWTERLFLAAGNGKVLHLFPYDIAAATYLAERSGVVITDGYGEPLGDTVLTDPSPANQQSCVAASNPDLHAQLCAEIDWKLGTADAFPSSPDP